MIDVPARAGVLAVLALFLYLDIRFTDWRMGMDGGGGSFAYTRTAGPIPEPSSACLMLAGASGLL